VIYKDHKYKNTKTITFITVFKSDDNRQQASISLFLNDLHYENQQVVHSTTNFIAMIVCINYNVCLIFENFDSLSAIVINILAIIIISILVIIIISIMVIIIMPIPS
jgi:hypothetical protein